MKIKSRIDRLRSRSREHLRPLIAAAVFLLPLSGWANELTESEFLDRIDPSLASASLARRLSEGQPIPAFCLPALGAGDPVCDKDLLGKPALMVFFALDSPARSRRSLQLLEAAEEIHSRMQGSFHLLPICSDAGGCAAEDRMSSLKLYAKVLNDSSRTAYGLFGIFMMPTALVVSNDGTLLARLPMTGEIVPAIEGTLRVALGEISAEELGRLTSTSHGVETSAEERAFRNHLELGRVLTSRRLHRQAEIEFSAATRLLPGRSSAWLELGRAQMRLERWAAAERSFLNVLDLQPSELDAIAGLGLALYHQGRHQEALPDLEEASMTIKPHPQVLGALGAIHAALGDKDRALDYYARALQRWEVLSEHLRSMPESSNPK